MGMSRKVRFGRWEGITLLLNGICVQVFLSFPRIMAQEGATAGWLLVLYNSLLVLLIFGFMSRLTLKYEGKDLLMISQDVGGNGLRLIVGSLLFFYFSMTVPLVLREFADGMIIIALPTSPLEYVILFLLAGMVAGAYFGLESIVRFHVLVVPIIIVGLLIILFSLAPFYDFTNLYPSLGAGSYNILVNGFNRISTFSILIVLFMISPYIMGHSNFRGIGYISIIAASVVLTFTTLIYLSVIPYPISTESYIPIYQMSRLIDVPRIFERIESIFIVIWTGSVLLFLSMGFYFLVYLFNKTFNLTYYRPLIIPFAILVFHLSFLPKNHLMFHLISRYFSHYAWVVAFLLTLIVLFAGNFLGTVESKGEANK